MTLTEFLLARIAEDERLLEDDDRVYGGMGEVWTIQAHARALADCQFKRKMLMGHEDEIHRCAWGDHTFDEIGCRVKSALAAVYADHPEYRDEWRPWV